jgi:hypothetical protein
MAFMSIDKGVNLLALKIYPRAPGQPPTRSLTASPLDSVLVSVASPNTNFAVTFASSEHITVKIVPEGVVGISFALRDPKSMFAGWVATHVACSGSGGPGREESI